MSFFTLEDLAQFPHDGTHLAVLGFPIRHSISPEMHNAALDAMRREHAHLNGWKYHRFEVPPERLIDALPQFHRAGFKGLNLTLPHKILAVPLCNEIDAGARPVGAVNTLRANATGWTGFNTDGQGMSDAIRQDLGIGLAGRDVILLGAGGAARAAAVQCLQEGCASLAVVNRSRENLDTLLGHLAGVSPAIPRFGHSGTVDPGRLPPNALVVNATSAGLRPEDLLPIDLAAIPEPCAVYDMIYNPAETALLAQARALGLRGANGLSMLVNQGARALEHWTGLPVPAAVMSQAAAAALRIHK